MVESNSPDKESPAESYLNAAKKSFSRVWNNPFLWFWGIFLPGFFWNIDYQMGSQNRPMLRMPFSGELSSLKAVREFLQSHGWHFLANNFETVLLYFAIVTIFLVLVYWALSAVTRAGVIRALDELQSQKASREFRFSYVWKNGQLGWKRILGLDIIILLPLLVILLALIMPLSILSASYSSPAFSLLMFLAFLIYIPLLFLGVYLRSLGAIHIVLANQDISGAIEVCYLHLLRSLNEASKLFLLIIMIGILEMLVFFVGLVIYIIMIVGAAAILVLISRSFVNNQGYVFVPVLFGLAIFLYLWIKSIFSLWQQDLWLWWAKKFGGIHAKEMAVAKDKKVLMEKTEPVAGS